MAIYLGHTTAQRILESKLALDLDRELYRGPLNCQSGKREVMDTIANAFKNDSSIDPDNPLYMRPGTRFRLDPFGW